MKHNLFIDGYSYRLRPVVVEDASFIIEARLEDMKRNKYIHSISSDVSLQAAWIEKYYTVEGDYYFVIENQINNRPEGLISIYNIAKNKGEWGRWVVRKDSLASVESFYLICRVAFEQLLLDEIYSRTIEDNKTVVAFHDSVQAKRRSVIPQCYNINDRTYNAIEHVVDSHYLSETIRPKMEKLLQLMQGRTPPPPTFEFHHVAMASHDIEREYHIFKLFGYQKEGNCFTDSLQGVKGQFIIAPLQPRIELLQNLEGSHTLDSWLNNKIKMYHCAYYVRNIDEVIGMLVPKRAKVVGEIKKSVYFDSRICFLVFSNMFMIEIIEKEQNNG
jgi:hypothetical protein